MKNIWSEVYLAFYKHNKLGYSLCINSIFYYIPDGETRRLKIPGFRLIDYIGHPRHGLATYVNQKVEDRLVNPVTGNEHTVGIRLDNLIIYNVYKPSSTNWSHHVLPTHQRPTVYVDDFNSHSTNWGYATENEDGEWLFRRATLHRLHLLYDAKQGGTFVSGRWGTATTPDLCFVTTDCHDQPLRTSHTILHTFPRTQHKPIAINIGLRLPRIDKPPMPR